MLELRKLSVVVAILAPLGCDERDERETATAETAADDAAADENASAADDGAADDEGEGTEGGDEGEADSGASDDAPMPDPDGGADYGICLHTCNDAQDCCFDGIECGKYPNSWDCSAGVCIPLGCTGDADCTYIAGTTCELTNGFAQCVMVCASDADCITDLGEQCVGTTDEGAGFCVVTTGGCQSNEECNPDGTTSFVCTEGACLCDGDDDCANVGGTCELETGLCHCMGNSTCPEGFACAA